MAVLLRNAVLLVLTLVALYPFILYAQGNKLGEINLETRVTGNKELPKILYIIPWATPPEPQQVDLWTPHLVNVFERTFLPVERLEQQRRLHYYQPEPLPGTE